MYKRSNKLMGKQFFFTVKELVPIVVVVMEARRPRTQENGKDIAMAPDFIFVSC